MFDQLSSLYKNKFIRGGALITVSTLIVNFSGYLFYSLIAKALGPKGYGEIVTLFSYMSIVSIPITIVVTVIIRRLGYAGKMREVVAQGFEKWFIGRLKQYWFILPFYFALFFIIPRITNLQPVSSLALLLLLLFGLINSVYFTLLQGGHFFAFFSFITVISIVPKLGGAIIALLGIGGLSIIYGGILAGLIIGIIPAMRILRNIKGTPHLKKYELDKNVASLIFDKQTIITLISLIGIVILGNADIIIVKKMFSAHSAGIYGAWSLFAKTVLYLLGPLNSMLLIFFSAKETVRDQKKVMNYLIGLLVIAGIILYVSYSAFGHLLVSVILSNKFSAIELLLPKAAIFGLSYAFVTIMNNYFITQKSNFSLIGITLAPLYLVMLLTVGKSLPNFILVNIVYTVLLAIAYLGAYVYTLKKQVFQS